MTADLINGVFELLGGWFVYQSVKQLRVDKQVHGVVWYTPTFFTSWGIWNLFYYPNLEQWFSLAGGIVLATMNIWWVVLLVRYSTKGGNDE